MRALALVPFLAGVILIGCVARQTAWSTLAAADVPDGSDAFVLVGDSALHLTHVEHHADRIRGRVAGAWRLPPVGVAAIADDTRTSSPKQIARRAGWPELRLAGRTLDVPYADIRSARATVDVEPNDDEAFGNSYGADNPPLLVVMTMSLVDYIASPCCRSCRR